MRAPIGAIYWFARTADDLADEGTATAGQRLADLAAYAQDLRACLADQPTSTRWAGVFEPLERAVRDFSLPSPPLFDLLDAFGQDVQKTRDHAGYESRAALLDYCRRSASPVGRLLLHLYGVDDESSLGQSDAICNALQLVNFWQDLSVDIPRTRFYVPAEDCRRHAMPSDDPSQWPTHPAAPALVEDLVTWARKLMLSGAPLVHRVPGRAGWELRLVVQGGLRILDRIEQMEYRSMQARPSIRGWDAPLLLWRAARM